MKKLFTLSVLTLIILSVKTQAQSTRLILAEEFTQASCPPCATLNPAFNTLLNSNPTKIVAIKYQTNWPGYDPMNVQTASFVDNIRVPYYQSGSSRFVPYATMDGTPQTGGSSTGSPANWTQTKLNARALVASPYDLTVTHTFSPAFDSIFVSVTITCTQAVTGNLKARVAVIERMVEFCSPPGTTNEKEFEGVMRTMLPDAYGTALASSWAVAQTQTLDFAAAIPTYVYDKAQLAVVAFVQNDATKEVHQAAYSAPQPQHFVIDGRLGCDLVTGIPNVSCGTPFAPTVEIENQGTTTLTSADIKYWVNGVAGLTVPWTGSLATHATASVQLPQISSPAGTHSLVVRIENPNGTMDYNGTYDEVDVPFNVYATTGDILPLVQPFDVNANASFPPNRWSLVNYDGGATWIQSVYGFNNVGAARMNFYTSPANQVDELWTPNYDFSAPGTITAQMDFDVAYCSYQGEADRLQIQYSTDCGQNWTTVFDESGTALSMGNPDTSASWHPWNSSHWHHKTVNLNSVVSNQSVFFKFKAISAFGNNLFIDNLNLSTNLTTSVPQISSIRGVNVYPNPSTGLIKVQFDLENSEDVTIVVSNTLGAIVKNMKLQSVTSGTFDIDLSKESKGAYEVSIRTSSKVLTKRIAITE